jgi:hypothetical protein
MQKDESAPPYTMDDLQEVQVPNKLKARLFADVRDPRTLSQLRLTKQAIYSTTPHDHSLYTANIAARFFPDVSKIVATDATANIGGNARAMIGKYKHVNLVEIEPIHANIAAHNLKLLGMRSGYSVITSNYLSTNLKQDLLFLDPPWGGVDYKRDHSKPLTLLTPGGDKIQIATIVSDRRADTPLIILKVPLGYNSRKFINYEEWPHNETHFIMNTPSRASYKLIVLSATAPRAELLTNYIQCKPMWYRDILAAATPIGKGGQVPP